MNQVSRQRSGRSALPTQAIVDSQSVQTIYRGAERGYDGEKKVKGRKCHIGVDSDGRLLHVQAHRANQHDGSAGIEMFDALVEKYPTLELLCADSAYGGMARDYAEILLDTAVQIVRKMGDGFLVAPKRWIVERTFAWLGHARRLSKDFEVSVRHSENMVRIAMLKLTLNQMFAKP